MAGENRYLEESSPGAWARYKIRRIFPWSLPDTIGSEDAKACIGDAYLKNFLNGEWVDSKKHKAVVDPLNGRTLLYMPDTSEDELKPFIESLKRCPRSGLHNPLYDPGRYRQYGDICAKAAIFLRTKTGRDYFARLIQRVMPKDIGQCYGEVDVVATFLETFSGDEIRFLANGCTTPGDRQGQHSAEYRWPYGPVAIIAPFNFPLEIPALQLIGALALGNKPIIKVASKVSIVIEAFVRLLLDCGMPRDDMLLIHCRGGVMEKLVQDPVIQVVQFTGSSRTAKRLKKLIPGELKCEDSGFDWKLFGPRPISRMFGFVLGQCDKDAFAASGQKCSAQSLAIIHKNWGFSSCCSKLKELAEKRNLEDLTNGPILSWTDDEIQGHIDALLKIPGAELWFGGEPVAKRGSIPKQYGLYKPTAVFVPLDQFLGNFDLVTKEIFAPVQVVTGWETDEDLELILAIFEKIESRLTAAIVSNDLDFLTDVLGRTTNGVTYVGIRARTTGAPTNHNFGPTGPHSAGIGTPGAILDAWSQIRTIVFDTDSRNSE